MRKRKSKRTKRDREREKERERQTSLDRGGDGEIEQGGTNMSRNKWRCKRSARLGIFQTTQ